ncbi:MAG: exo-beta-N-acetylmuramidase NamZ domain-containing protein [Spirochaetota bacterium]
MIINGLDIWLEEIDRIKQSPFALVANQTSLTANWEYSWHALGRMGIKPAVLFSPEHGLFSTEQDQVAVDEQPVGDMKVVSLYGNNEGSLVPDRKLFESIESIVFDIQDIGTRYYTYANTMALIMEELHGSGIELVVLDRPNPLGGTVVEGPMLDERFRSFVGVFNVPVRHGLTVGELALLYRDTLGLDVKLRVIHVKGYSRNMLFPHYGVSWVPQSPNMPTFETALLYPGMCLLEGTNVSEGRGTTSPFHLAGAPFVDPFALVEYLRSELLDDFIFRPVYFKPWHNKYAGETAGGVYTQVVNPHTRRSFLGGVALAGALAQLYSDDFRFLHDVYEFNNAYPAFDLLCGSSTIREMIQDGSSLGDIDECIQDENSSFRKEKSSFHLYE